MQISTCLLSILLTLPTIHIYAILTQISTAQGSVLNDESVKIFLVAIYNIIITIATASSLRLKFFVPTACFLFLYFLAVLFLANASLPAHFQNLGMLWLIIISSVAMSKLCESTDRKYFALVRMTQKMTSRSTIISIA
jgi:hypothetical protein